MRTRGILAGAALAAAALALAACASTSGQKVAKNGNQKNKTHMVCFMDTALGSHIGHETCMTEAQYKAKQKADAESARKFRDMQQNNTQMCTDSGTCSGGGPPRR